MSAQALGWLERPLEAPCATPIERGSVVVRVVPPRSS
jgi:hypothetical protein